MDYTYFISYVDNMGYGPAFDNRIIKRPRPIVTATDIKELTDYLSLDKRYPASVITILNIVLLDQNERNVS